jgi:hypothetical protein
VTGFRRAMNAILFMDDWSSSWGGALELWSELRIEACIYPGHNRLVVFETDDRAFHGIPRPMTAPPGVWRRSFAVYFWEPGSWSCLRPRAKFMCLPGEYITPEKKAWQSERCYTGVQG